jgi:hypothetical protein
MARGDVLLCTAPAGGLLVLYDRNSPRQDWVVLRHGPRAALTDEQLATWVRQAGETIRARGYTTYQIGVVTHDAPAGVRINVPAQLPRGAKVRVVFS